MLAMNPDDSPLKVGDIVTHVSLNGIFCPVKGHIAPLALFRPASTWSAIAPVIVGANPLRVAAVVEREDLFIGGFGF
jgi:hypothetical protein